MKTTAPTLTREQMIALIAKDSEENTNWGEVIHLDGNTPLPEKTIS